MEPAVFMALNSNLEETAIKRAVVNLCFRPPENGKYDFGTYFALSKTGSIRTYSVEVQDFGTYAVMTTLKQTTLGGKVTADTYEFRKGVNIGKSNEGTYLDVAFTRAKHAVSKLKDAGFTTTMPTEGQKYNTDASGKLKPMLASAFDAAKIQFPCLVQPKYDGVRCIISADDDGNVHIVSRNGKPYRIPQIEKWAREHIELLPLDGELYCHKELTFQEIVSAVKRVSPLTAKINYVVYDIPVEHLSFEERMDRLWSYGLPLEYPTKESPVYVSPTYRIFNLPELTRAHDRFVDDGFEGAIIRNVRGQYEFGFRSNDLIKFKLFKDDEFRITDVVEATGRDAGTAIFVCACEGGAFSVKPQGSHRLRAKYLEDREKLIGKMLTVKYQGLSDSNIPRFPSAISVRDYE